MKPLYKALITAVISCGIYIGVCEYIHQRQINNKPKVPESNLETKVELEGTDRNTEIL